MKEDSLLYFESPRDLKDFIQELDIYHGWKIQEGLMNDRGKLIEQKPYTIKLRELFKEKGFFRKNVSLAEIVSWLDNLVLIQRLLQKLEKTVDKEVFSSINISVEYMIEMSKRMRIDYILIYKSNMLLLELRTVSNFNKVRSTWEKKFQELITYKEIMSYYKKTFRIKLYALIPLFEYSNKKKIDKHIDNNNKQIEYLAEFVRRYLLN